MKSNINDWIRLAIVLGLLAIIGIISFRFQDGDVVNHIVNVITHLLASIAGYYFGHSLSQ